MIETMDPLNSNLDFQMERIELDAVLSSKLFMRAPGLINFLKYVCGKYFEGNSSQIKEYNIATEALGRSGDFQQKRIPLSEWKRTASANVLPNIMSLREPTMRFD